MRDLIVQKLLQETACVNPNNPKVPTIMFQSVKLALWKYRDDLDQQKSMFYMAVAVKTQCGSF